MDRRELLKQSAALGLVAALPLSLTVCRDGRPGATSAAPPDAPGGPPSGPPSGPDAPIRPLSRPVDGSAVPVAFLVSRGAVVIDFAGPWEVFTNVMPGGRMDVNTFRPYTVAETARPITATGGLTIVPNFTIRTAPPPAVLVIPAQDDPSDAVLDWIRRTAGHADLTMSVCTGAFILAKTGLLAGKAATTHHGAYADFAAQFPDVRLERGVRFVEDGNVASSGGLTCGIDLALHVVARYFGRDVAAQAAANLEYASQGWRTPTLNAGYGMARTTVGGQPACVVCSMAVDGSKALTSRYRGTTYYFCSPAHRRVFDAAPDRILAHVAA